MSRKLIKAAAYLRRSDTDQKGSLENQRETILDFLKRHPEYTIVEWYVDDGISGDATEDRADFLRMRNDASSGAFSVVLCRNQDRFGRFDLLDAGYWIKPFRDAGVSLVTADDGPIQWNDFTGRLVYAIKQEGKHQYLRDLSRGVTDGQMKAAKKGSWSGSAPFGYKIVGPKLDKRLELDDPAHVQLVKRIFSEYVKQGRNLAEIAKRLNADGIKSPSGKQWKHLGVRCILANDAYIGRMVFNRKSYSKYHHWSDGAVKEGGKYGLNPESDWIVHEDHHEAIIDVPTFNKAQAKLANGKRGVVKWNAGDFLFAGKLCCGRCGAPLWGLKNGNKKAGKTHLYYECSKRKRNGFEACDGTTVREDFLLEDIIWTLEHRVMSQDAVDVLESKAKKGRQLKPADMPIGFATLKRMFLEQHKPKVSRKTVESQIKSLEANIAKLERNQMYADDEKTFERIGKEIVLRKGQLEAMREQLAEELTDDETNAIVLSVLDKFLRLSQRDREQVKAAIREIDKIVVHTELIGHGNGTRHQFKHGEIYLFGINLNWQRKAVKRRVRGIDSDLNPDQPD